jgi:hypothetical protein
LVKHHSNLKYPEHKGARDQTAVNRFEQQVVSCNEITVETKICAKRMQDAGCGSMGSGWFMWSILHLESSKITNCLYIATKIFVLLRSANDFKITAGTKPIYVEVN